MTLLRILPAPIIAAPERILLKFACLMIGVGLLISFRTNDGTLAAFPDWTVIELGLTFFTGGLASLLGIFRRNRALERFGVATTAFAAASYAAALIALYPGRFAGIIIFIGVALACALRLLISSAAARVLLAAKAYVDDLPTEPDA